MVQGRVKDRMDPHGSDSSNASDGFNEEETVIERASSVRGRGKM
jgi:hypothetical protein